MPRPPKKKTRVTAKAFSKGLLQGQTEHDAKTFKNKKQLQVWLKDRLESLIENIDPLEIVAVAGLTILIKQGIEWTEDIPLTLLQKNSLIRTLMRFVPLVGLSFDIFVPDLPPEAIEALKKAMDSPPMEIIQYVASFIVAFIIVRHADRIIEAGGNILGVAKGLMGALIAI